MDQSNAAWATVGTTSIVDAMTAANITKSFIVTLLLARRGSSKGAED